MNFEHDHHRAVYDQVRDYLDELFENVANDETSGHFYVQYGSTVLEIGVDAYGPQEVLVQIIAYCVQGATVDDELSAALLQLNHTLPVGAFSLIGSDVFFSYEMFGHNLDRKNLLSAIGAVANISDEYDDLIVEKFGGHRALDRIRSTGGARRRRKAASH